MRAPPASSDMPPIPQDGDGPVFKEPWEARAFSLVLSLYDRGCFTWPEWVDHLSAQIAAAKERGEADAGDTYYQYWLAALEAIVVDKSLASASELGALKDAWQEADRARGFGEAPVLRSPVSAATDEGAAG